MQVIGRRPFAGYWEYMLDRPFFTGPAHPFWGGGALIGEDGKLLGIGSLVVQQSAPDGEQLDLNMVVPVELLTPILDELLSQGRSSAPPRPWLGVYCAENDGHVFVQRTSPGGPADKAGIRPGDQIVAVGDVEVDDLIALWAQHLGPRPRRHRDPAACLARTGDDSDGGDVVGPDTLPQGATAALGQKRGPGLFRRSLSSRHPRGLTRGSTSSSLNAAKSWMPGQARP